MKIFKNLISEVPIDKKNAISYVKNEPPAFIQKFKEKIGYKEEPDVNAKVTLQLVEHRLTVTRVVVPYLCFKKCNTYP
jgi:hypothetical protein